MFKEHCDEARALRHVDKFSFGLKGVYRSKKVSAVGVQVIHKSIDAILFEGPLLAATTEQHERREREIRKLLMVATELLSLRRDGLTWTRIGRLVRRSEIADLDDQIIRSVLLTVPTVQTPEN